MMLERQTPRFDLPVPRLSPSWPRCHRAEDGLRCLATNKTYVGAGMQVTGPHSRLVCTGYHLVKMDLYKEPSYLECSTERAGETTYISKVPHWFVPWLG
jgi:hypothetical protein